MRVFGIQSDGKFSEYVETPFHAAHEEAVLEDWLESNPDGIVEDGHTRGIMKQNWKQPAKFIPERDQ